MTPPLILVTGSTGYIASRLIPHLLDSGYRVRALARQPHRLKGRSWFHQVEAFAGDVMSPSSLPAALKGVHTAYYLIHNMTAGRGYTEREIEGARNFASAAEKAGIQHIIYLGGLADPEQYIAPHMRSRIQTGMILSRGRVPVTEFRAGPIVGSGSISFEMIRFMTELFPIVPGPVWLNNKTQPIAVQNVIDYLLAALTNPNGRGQVFEIGGPEIVPYKDLLVRYARARGMKRRFVLLPHVPVWFMAFGVGLMTPVPRLIAYALIGGLSTDSVVRYPEAQKVFPEVRLSSIDEATRKALGYSSPFHIERVWEDGVKPVKTIKHEGSFIHHRELMVNASAERAFEAIRHGLRSGWHVEAEEADKRLIARIEKQWGGVKWIEWRVSRTPNVTLLAQTVFFAPRGLPGFIYWYLLYPFHVLVWRGLIHRIVHQAERPKPLLDSTE